MKNSRKILFSFFVVFMFSLSCSLFGPTGRGSSGDAVAQSVSADQGATLELGNGASLHIPPKSLPADIRVSMQVLQKEAEASEAFQPAGSLYEISLGKAALDTPAELTLPYDPDLLPDDVTPEMLFIAYFDEAQGQWVYAGGEVDQSQQVIRLQTQHASRWSVSYWNWVAWIAVLNKLLEANWASVIEAVDLFTNDCPQNGSFVQVQNVDSQNLIQGCVESENGWDAQLRVINPKSFYYEIKGYSIEQGITFSKMLSPGESYDFNIDIRKPSPMTVSAEITQAAGYRLVIHQILMMLPGFNAIQNQPQAVACLTERLHDVAYFASAAEALSEMDDLSGLAAAESIRDFLKDENAVRRFLTASDDCVPDLAKTWSLKGMSSIANSANVIISSTDYVANSLAMMFRGETGAQVKFQWEQMAVDLTDPQSVVNWVKHTLKTGNADLFRDLMTHKGVYYASHMEGGQNITNNQFLADLQQRIASKPICQGVYLSGFDMFIWYSNWQPAWQMTEFCYSGCKTLSPPWESNAAAFMFKLEPEAKQYYFRGMYQNTIDEYFYFDDYSLISCDNAQPLAAPTLVSQCPGSPPQRLKVGEQGRVCTKKDGVYLRVNPGKESEKIALLKPGTRFTVLDGPECAGNNWSWWKVKLSNGQVGWLAEGGDSYDAYFLCPDD